MTETKFRIHNIVSKADLKHGSEVWILNRRDEQKPAASQKKFSCQLLRITRLDKERNKIIREKLGIENIVSEIKHYRNQCKKNV